MRKPFYQTILILTGLALAGIILLGQFLDAVANALNFFNIQRAKWITIIVITLYISIEILRRFKQLKWLSPNRTLFTISKLGVKIIIPIAGALILIWGAALFNNNSKNSPNVKASIFNLKDEKFKILILPFLRQCEYMGFSYDIGHFMSQRLEKLNIEDTLNILTYYYTDTLDLRNLTTQIADSLMYYHHANLIIYGSYSLKQCEGDSNTVCFNYRTDSLKWNSQDYHSKSLFNTINIAEFGDLQNGTGQEAIDYVIYSMASLVAYNKKEFQKSITYLKKIKDYQVDEKASISIAVSYFKLKDFENSKKILLKLLESHSKSYYGWLNLGVVYAENNNLIEAKNCFSTAIEYSKENELAWYNLGHLYSNSNKTDSCIISFESGLRANNASHILWIGLIQKYYEIGKIEKSEELSKLYLNLFSKSEESWLNYFYVLNERKQYKEAVKCLKKALEIKPDELHIWIHLGNAYFDLGDFKKCLYVVRKLRKKDANGYFALNLLGKIYFKQHKYDESRKVFQESLDITQNSEALGYLGNILFLEGRFNESKDAAEAALKLNETNAEAYNLLGGIAYENHDHEVAKLNYKKAIDFAPKEPIYWLNLGNNYYYNSQKDSALICWEFANKLDSNVRSPLVSKIKEDTLRWEVNNLLFLFPDGIFEISDQQLFNSFILFKTPSLKAWMNNGSLRVNADIRDSLGKLIGRITENEWIFKKRQGFDRNFDDNAFEVVDNRGKIVFQLSIYNNKVNLQGIFYHETREATVIQLFNFPDNPKYVRVGIKYSEYMPLSLYSMLDKVRPLFAYPSDLYRGKRLENR